MNAPVLYYPKFVPDPDVVLATLLNDLDWERRDAPRSEYYFNDFPAPYSYGQGKGRRTYHPHPYHPIILTVRKQLETLTGVVFEACFVNCYRNQSDHLGWHADNSPEMDDVRPIAIISFGAEREIWFRPKSEVNRIEKLKLEHGSAAIMAPGMQDAWEHRIPKAGFQCSERVSLTFRGYCAEPIPHGDTTEHTVRRSYRNRNNP
jgi:alkylated DNA repair dioxygenase AlkB